MKAFRLVIFLAFVFMVSPAAWGQVPVMQNGSGLTVVQQQTLDNRLYNVEVSTPALPAGPANVRILLPADYNSQPNKRFPVLYLFHGTSGSAADWTVAGNAEPATAGLELIVVMPDIGLNNDGGGFCVNWVDGSQNWETFEIDQLIPWIDSNLRTSAVRSQRAIAGLSEGGFCSTGLASRHPDLFGSVGAFSGLVDVAYGIVPSVNADLVFLDLVGTQGVLPKNVLGDHVTDQLNWAAHDPTTMAVNLTSTKIYQFFGNGLPGPLDPAIVPANVVPAVGAGAAEAALSPGNIGFHNRLTALNIPSYYDSYGPGTHSYPYWDRDLTQLLPMLMQDFANPSTPSSISYTSADNSYSVWDWNVQMNRMAPEFSALAGASCSGFTLSGSGSAAVTTPPCFTPGHSYNVSTMGAQSGSSTTTITAGGNGTLLIQVPLGPANPFQAYTALAAIAGTKVYTTGVTIAPAN